VECPGCGIDVPNQGGLSGRFNASEECWRLFGELSAYTLTRGGSGFIHQHAVDAYGAQHAGGSSSNLGTAFSLIGLCLTLEKGYTGRQVQVAHMRLGKLKKQWPKLEPPRGGAALTVQDVLSAGQGAARDEMLLKWASSVWSSWHSQHDWTRQTVAELL
jgi:hypothetical protein